jgi:hypothetical protein
MKDVTAITAPKAMNEAPVRHKDTARKEEKKDEFEWVSAAL